MKKITPFCVTIMLFLILFGQIASSEEAEGEKNEIFLKPFLGAFSRVGDVACFGFGYLDPISFKQNSLPLLSADKVEECGEARLIFQGPQYSVFRVTKLSSEMAAFAKFAYTEDFNYSLLLDLWKGDSFPDNDTAREIALHKFHQVKDKRWIEDERYFRCDKKWFANLQFGTKWDLKIDDKELTLCFVPPGTGHLLGKPLNIRAEYGIIKSVTAPKAVYPPCFDKHIGTSYGFWMSETEITADLYKQFCITTGRKYDGESAYYAVGDEDKDYRHEEFTSDSDLQKIATTRRSYKDAMEFCSYLNSKLPSTVKGVVEFRLPTLAEHRVASEGGSKNSFYWGSSKEDIANFEVFDAPKPPYVKRKSPNPFGLYDIYGNAGEWILDTWNFASKVALNDGELNPLGSVNSKLHSAVSYYDGFWNHVDFSLGKIRRYLQEEQYDELRNVSFRVVLSHKKWHR